MNEHVISLVLGDWSHDGHSKSDTIVLKSNLSKKEIQTAYKKASKALGFCFISEVCEEYEDRMLPKDKLDILIKNGFKISDFGILSKFDKDELEEAMEEDSVNGFSLWIDTFTNVYLWIVKLGNKDFEYKILGGDSSPEINIGGYGLYA